MDFPRALTQIAEIHEQIAKGEIYRGYRSLPIAASGVVGIAAALVQPVASLADPIAFVWYWTVVAAVAALVGISEIVYNYVFHEQASGRRRTRMVLGQFLPGILGAAVLTDELRALEPSTRRLAARGLGHLFRHRDVLVAAVPAAGKRARGVVLLRGRVAAVVDRESRRTVERLACRRDVWNRTADGGDGLVLETRES